MEIKMMRKKRATTHIIILKDREVELKWPSKTFWRQISNRVAQVIWLLLKTLQAMNLLTTKQAKANEIARESKWKLGVNVE